MQHGLYVVKCTLDTGASMNNFINAATSDIGRDSTSHDTVVRTWSVASSAVYWKTDRMLRIKTRDTRWKSGHSLSDFKARLGL